MHQDACGEDRYTLHPSRPVRRGRDCGRHQARQRREQIGEEAGDVDRVDDESTVVVEGYFPGDVVEWFVGAVPPGSTEAGGAPYDHGGRQRQGQGLAWSGVARRTEGLQTKVGLRVEAENRAGHIQRRSIDSGELTRPLGRSEPQCHAIAATEVLLCRAMGSAHDS